MNNYYGQDWTREDAPKIESGALANSFLSRIFTIMTLGLAITGVLAWVVAGALVNSAGEPTELFFTLFSGPMSWIIMLSPLAFILVLSYGLNKMSYLTATIIFIAFCSVMGISLSSIFLLYEIGSIAKVFFITGGVFAAMAIVGYTTKVDLTKIGTIAMFALFGIIIASIVNWFAQSEGLEYLISGAGVVIFMALTAWDVQRFMRMGYAVQEGEQANKLALMGALALYLDFINLFLFLLRLLGSRE